MSSLEEKKAKVTSEVWIQILMSVDDLVNRGYIDASRKNAALEKFLDDYLDSEQRKRAGFPAQFDGRG